ncbi:MAG: hypothetical protein LBI81_00475, partial [Puniceicoccales bacterium]|nr:hypothetical protein [Puniceicoccales bacterium]
DGTTLEINLSFDEIEKNKDLYIVTDFSGQKRFICVNQPSPVILGHELGHVIQMLSLKTSNINVALEAKWSTTIMNSLGSAVIDEVCKVLGENANVFRNVGISNPTTLFVWLEKLYSSKGDSESMLTKEIKLPEKLGTLIKDQESKLENIYEAYLFALITWNAGTYAELFNILPKQNGDAVPAQWSDGQLLKEVELLRNFSSDVSTMASYYEIDASGKAIASKIDNLSISEEFTKNGVLPVRFGHNPNTIKNFMNFNEQTKKYTWTFIGSLLGAFDVSDVQLPIIL